MGKGRITFFPVGNGDMTLIELESDRQILIDVNIRGAADDPDDDTFDVAGELRKRLKKDEQGRTYVDAFLLSHPDQDHCRGLRNHFHLGKPEDWVKTDNKILINEIWSSPMIFRRASKDHVLCEDAEAFNKEARRRVLKFKGGDTTMTTGNRVLILGEDENGKTDGLDAILVKTGEVFDRIDGVTDGTMAARLLAPMPKSDDEEVENLRSKNHSSSIINFTLSGEGKTDACLFLTGGDAEVAIWDMLWERTKDTPEHFSYDIMQTPHHCSWHSLSYDSWGDMGEDAEVNENARNALSQARTGAIIVATSNEILDDDNDPPCIRAKREYEEIADEAGGEFVCTGDTPNSPLEFEITGAGLKPKPTIKAAPAYISSGAVGRQPLGHGDSDDS